MSCEDATLPPYTRDPETTSIRSAAPSYVSNAPSYHSQRATEGETRCQNHTRSGSSGGAVAPSAILSNNNSNISWSSIHGHQSRAYLSVANRRAARPQPMYLACHQPALHQNTPSVPLSSRSSNSEVEARAKRERDEEALREESKAWEFMWGQMRDWEEREREWRKFREVVEGRAKKGLGERLLTGLGRGAGWG